MKKAKEKAYTFVSKEFLYRLTYLFFCFFFSCLSSWVYGKEMLYLYLYPLTILSQNIMFTSISEAFTTTYTVCLYMSFVCTFPFFLYLCVCFFLPSLFPKERNSVYKICIYIPFSFYAGIVLCSLYIIPELCSWFLKYGTSTDFLHLYLNAKVSSYLSWSGRIYMFCICVLQMPIGFLVFFKFFYKEKTFSRYLSGNRKYIYVSLLLLCATISPPDLYNQGVLFLVFIYIFEFFLWYLFLEETVKISRKKKYTKSSAKPL